LIDAAMQAVKETYGLIIDLRNDSGGNISALRLTSYLLPGPRMALALLSRPFLEKLGGAPEQLDLSKIPRVSGVYTTRGIIDAMKSNGGGVAFYTEDLGDRRYRGRVVLLINKGTGSASEGFAAGLKGQKAITLVGRTTLGALLGSERFELPGGWELTVPTHASWRPDGRKYVDQPVSPDIEVKWTLQDFCDQRDPDIAKALELLESYRP
jgi:carboxyl-terminal processing protease